MSLIYCITNDINGKQYVGKTEFSIEKGSKNIALIVREKDVKNVLCITQ